MEIITLSNMIALFVASHSEVCSHEQIFPVNLPIDELQPIGEVAVSFELACQHHVVSCYGGVSGKGNHEQCLPNND